jgi:hypothetical protein
MLYSTLNPGTGVTPGKINADSQVFAGEVIMGAVGNITTFAVLLLPHKPLPAVPAGVPPHACMFTYLATME